MMAARGYRFTTMLWCFSFAGAHGWIIMWAAQVGEKETYEANRARRIELDFDNIFSVLEKIRSILDLPIALRLMHE
jgi:hypothetical protein